MLTTEILDLLVLLGLLAASAFFSATEIALFSLSKLQLRRLRSDHPHRGQMISELLEKPQRLLSAILFGNTLATIAGAVVGYDFLQRTVPEHADALAVPAMTLLILVCGEVAPKAVVIRRADVF